MAIVTLPVASFANELVKAEVDFDDVQLRVRVARVINNSGYPALFEIFKSGTLAVSAIAPANAITSRNPPANIRYAFDAGDPENDIPPELFMNDIEIHCRWPS